MKRHSKNSKKVNNILAQVKVQSGLDRKKYFENSGELTRWRGIHTVQRNKIKYTRKSKHSGCYS